MAPETAPTGRPREERWADLAFAGAVVGALVVAALLYLAFPPLVFILLVSALFSYALLPAVDRLDRHLPRTAAVLVVALGIAGLLALAAVLLAPGIASQLGALPKALGKAVEAAAGLWDVARASLPRTLAQLAEATFRSAQGAFSHAAPAPERLAGWATRTATWVTTLAGATVFVPIFVLLMLRGYHHFLERARSFVPPRWLPAFTARSRQADLVLSGFVRGQMLVAGILAVIYGTAFSLVGIPLGLVVGIAAGLGEMVPFLGGAIALGFGSLMALAGGQASDVLWVAGIYAVVQGLQATVLSPLIVGSKANLGPATVIVALAVGGQVFGLTGLLLAVPAAALLKVAARAAFDAYRDSRFFQGTAQS